MRVARFSGGTVLTLMLGAAPSAGNETDSVFDFFAQEAQVMTASLQPTRLSDAPATVYVVTAEDIAASGGNSLWDALRGVPGVDVMTTRAWHGEVGIRGLNGPLNNRVLVLLDGKTVLNGFFDFVTWEAIPVALAEIDRIEVVLGPASALYGANAVNGVINIITDPEHQDIPVGEVSLGVGERSTRTGHVLYGRSEADGSRWRGSAAWRSGDQFESDTNSSRVFKTHGTWIRPLGGTDEFRLSAGFAGHDTQLAASGAAGAAFNDGANGFVHAELDWQGTHWRAFWNRGRSTLRGFDRFNDPNTDYDTIDLAATRELQVGAAHQLVAGASYRHNRMRSRAFGPGALSQDLWAAYIEDAWALRPSLNATLSGRADWHPETGLSYSPRASLTMHITPQQVVRVSLGTAFRNPTLTENFIEFTDSFAYDGNLGPDLQIETIDLTFRGNRNLDSEHLLFAECSYTGLFGPVRASVAGFRYRLHNVIGPGDPESFEFALPVIRIVNSFVNGMDIDAWGGEVGAVADLGRGFSGYSNYARFQLDGSETADLLAMEGGPAHKANVGARLRRGAWLADVSAHRVSSTTWDSSPLPGSPTLPVDAYHLLNAHVSLHVHVGSPLRISLDVFNLTDHHHAQLLPAQPDGGSGQFGEMLQRRILLSVTARL